MWNQDPFGFPINARPFSAVGTIEKIDIAEVLNQIVKKACDFEKPKAKVSTPTAATTTTATTTTTAYRKTMAEVTVKDEAAIEKGVDRDQVLAQPVVVAEAAYPNLVSIFSKNEFISNIQLKWLEIYLWSLN